MDEQRVETLLRQYGRTLPPERLMSESQAAALRSRLRPENADEHPGGLVTTANGTATTPIRPQLPVWYRARGVILAAAAAIALFFILWSRGDHRVSPGLQADGAGEAAALFRNGGGRAENDQFFIGVRLDRRGYVRVLAISDRDEVSHVGLGDSGAHEVAVAEATNVTFGPLHLKGRARDGQPTQTRAFIVLASNRPIPEAELGVLLRAHQAGARSADALARDLAQQFKVSVRVLHPVST